MFKELNILKPFMDEPTREFTVRETAKAIGVSPATASSFLKGFAKKGMLLMKEQGRLDLYRANIESDLYRDVKVFYNVRRIRECGLIDALSVFYVKPPIVLFGSFSDGTDTKTSDIDLLVVSENTKDFPEKEKFGRMLGRPLQVFAVKDVSGMNPHLANSAASGITLQGMVKWI